MKIASTLLLTFLLATVVQLQTVHAQDDRMPDLDSGIRESRPESSPEVLPEADLRAFKPSSVNRDSVQVKPSVKRNDPKARSEDSSVLSFNFLYYLIERFKLSDIVD